MYNTWNCHALDVKVSMVSASLGGIDSMGPSGLAHDFESDQALVIVDGLCKRYGRTTALDGISFSIQVGEAFGLLGANGAGKTTLLSVMAGFTRADAGDVFIGGLSVRKKIQEIRRMIGVVPQGIALYHDLTARQNLCYFARLRGLKRSERVRQVEEILELIGLGEYAGTRVAQLSGGMIRRLNIGIGLLGRPRLLLLDEPTVGIDTQARRQILNFVRHLVDDGVTVLYTTHHMDEVESICDRVAIIDHGRMIASGSINEMRAMADDRPVLCIPLTSDALHCKSKLETLKQAVSVPVERVGDELRIMLSEGSSQLPTILKILQEHSVRLDQLRVETADLETVFLSLIGKSVWQLREGSA